MLTILSRNRPVFVAALLASSIAVFPVASNAKDPQVQLSADKSTPEAYWTQERMSSAKPMPLPKPKVAATELAKPVLLDTSSASIGRPAFEPKKTPTPQSQVVIGLDSGLSGEIVGPTMIAQPGYPFTTRRVSPDATVKTSPFQRAGKFFFTIPGQGNFVCSASIINRRIVLTAGHCVYDRATQSFYTNFAFAPAYNGAVAPSDPYCRWTPNYSTVPAQWASSSGYPATDDFAVLVMNDRSCNGATRQIGVYLGWFGWQTGRLIGNNITQLGYPVNLDSGNRMQVSQSNVYQRASYAGEIGSAQGGGTSGGPWVQNFGVVPSGQVPIGASGYTGSNQVVGVSSYGATAHNSFQYGGSSVLNANFVRIYNTACSRTTGNCQ